MEPSATLAFLGGIVIATAGFTSGIVLWIWKTVDGIRRENSDDIDKLKQEFSARYHKLDGSHDQFSTIMAAELRLVREDLVRIKAHLGMNGPPPKA